MMAANPRNKRRGAFYKDLAKTVERILAKRQTATDRRNSRYRDKDPCRSDWYRLARYIEASLKSQFGLLVTDFQFSTSDLKELKGVRLKEPTIPVLMKSGGAA